MDETEPLEIDISNDMRTMSGVFYSTIIQPLFDENIEGIYIDKECTVSIFNYNGFFEDGLTWYVKQSEPNDPDRIIITLETNTEEPVAPLKIKKGTYPYTPYLERDGYLFLGWYLDDKFNIKLTYNLYFDEDTTLYAKWEKLTGKTISFETNTPFEMTPILSSYTQTYRLPSPSLDGYAFLGWFEDKELENEVDHFSLSNIEEDVTVYAKWRKKNKVTVMLDGQVFYSDYIDDFYQLRYRDIYSLYDEGAFFEWYEDDVFTKPLDFNKDVIEDTVVYLKRLPVFDIVFHNDYGKLPKMKAIANWDLAKGYFTYFPIILHVEKYIEGYFFDEAHNFSVFEDDHQPYLIDGVINVYIKWSADKAVDIKVISPADGKTITYQFKSDVSYDEIHSTVSNDFFEYGTPIKLYLNPELTEPFEDIEGPITNLTIYVVSNETRQVVKIDTKNVLPSYKVFVHIEYLSNQLQFDHYQVDGVYYDSDFTNEVDLNNVTFSEVYYVKLSEK